MGDTSRSMARSVRGRASSGGTGGPLNSTISLVLYVYQQAFAALPSKMGYAAAMTVVLFLIILAITILQLKVLSRDNVDY